MILRQILRQDKPPHRIPRSLRRAKRGSPPADLRQRSTAALIRAGLNLPKAKQGTFIPGPRPLPRHMKPPEKALLCQSPRHPIPQDRAAKSLCGNGRRMSLCDRWNGDPSPISPYLRLYGSYMAAALMAELLFRLTLRSLPMEQADSYPPPWSRAVRNLCRSDRKKRRHGAGKNSAGQGPVFLRVR